MHYLTEEQKNVALEEMRRVLKPHGRICFGDVMFETEAQRKAYIASISQRGEWDSDQDIEQTYYADLSQLIHWLEQYRFTTSVRRMDDGVYIVYAELVY